MIHKRVIYRPRWGELKEKIECPWPARTADKRIRNDLRDLAITRGESDFPHMNDVFLVGTFRQNSAGLSTISYVKS